MMSNVWSKKKGLGSESDHEDEEDQGLRSIITTKLIVAKPDPKIIVKPIFVLNKIIQSISSSSNSATHDHDHDNHHSYCYLKSCHLCHKHLSLDKEVYMYMGDMGFCSLECRDRQIYLDDVKEMEISTQKVLASFRRRDGGGLCEDNNLFEDFRQQRRHPFSSPKKKSFRIEATLVGILKLDASDGHFRRVSPRLEERI